GSCQCAALNSGLAILLDVGRCGKAGHAPVHVPCPPDCGPGNCLRFMCPMPATPTILVFDSGLGGLTVFREVIKARPDARFVYAADDAFFPYGRQPEAALVERVVAVMTELIAEHAPDLVVIACNTASTLVLPQLRARFAVPFVGTVPAIKPACAGSASRMVSVLGTEATVKREHTHALIRDFSGGCAVTLVGSPRLAELAEAELKGEAVTDA